MRFRTSPTYGEDGGEEAGLRPAKTIGSGWERICWMRTWTARPDSRGSGSRTVQERVCGTPELWRFCGLFRLDNAAKVPWFNCEKQSFFSLLWIMSI